MTNPLSSASQPPHVPTLVWGLGGVLVIIVLYHLVHRHG